MEGIDNFLRTEEEIKHRIQPSNRNDTNQSASCSYIAYVKSKFATLDMDAEYKNISQQWRKDYDVSNPEMPLKVDSEKGCDPPPIKVTKVDEDGIDIIDQIHGAIGLDTGSSELNPSPLKVDNFVHDEDDDLVMDYLPSGMQSEEKGPDEASNEPKETSLVSHNGASIIPCVPETNQIELLMNAIILADESDEEEHMVTTQDSFIETLSMSSNDSDSDSDPDSITDGNDGGTNNDADKESDSQVDSDMLQALAQLHGNSKRFKGIATELLEQRGLGVSNNTPVHSDDGSDVMPVLQTLYVSR